VTMVASVPPLAFVSVFGATMILAWTGQVDPSFRMVVWLSALAALFKGISLLQLILYRASGRALLDNIRQALRLAGIFAVALFGRRLGFQGVLIGAAAVGLLGVLFMFVVKSEAFQAFSVRTFMADTLRISAASTMIVGCGWLASLVPVPCGAGDRISAIIKLSEIAIGCLIVAWPALVVSRSLSNHERRTVLGIVISGRRAPLTAAS
jgi:hypothetical protein